MYVRCGRVLLATMNLRRSSLRPFVGITWGRLIPPDSPWGISLFLGYFEIQLNIERRGPLA